MRPRARVRDLAPGLSCACAAVAARERPAAVDPLLRARRSGRGGVGSADEGEARRRGGVRAGSAAHVGAAAVCADSSRQASAQLSWESERRAGRIAISSPRTLAPPRSINCSLDSRDCSARYNSDTERLCTTRWEGDLDQMSSTSPASSRARIVLYRHMCCEPCANANSSPLQDESQTSATPRRRSRGERRTHSGRTTGAQSLRARQKTGWPKSGDGTA